MPIQFTGVMGWIITILIAGTALSIVIAGTWMLWEYFVWEIIVRKLLLRLKLYKVFIQFILHRKDFLEWLKKEEE